MQLSSKSGHMVSDYYPVKTRDGVKQYDRVLRILTFMGQTMSKRIMTTEQYVNEVYDKIHKFEYVDNNVDHSNMWQFVSSTEVTYNV